MDKINVLDHGYVSLVGYWGSEEHIIEAARMSTGKGFLSWDTDQKLLEYLYKNKHSTPFEMAGVTIEVSAPIFIFREWHRHRTQSYNEMSGRYTPLPNVNYLPEFARIMAGMQQTANKQAQGNGRIALSDEVGNWLGALEGIYDRIQELYALGLEIGIPKELARLPIPVARYSRMRASANLRNWLGFLTLRDSPNAQWEMQEYAKAVGQIISEKFPRTYKLYQSEQA